jgi:hypothetical protein
MKPELHRVVLRLVQLADPEAPGLKFVSPGIARK